MRDVVIASAVRTPIGNFMGALSSVSAVDLGAHAIKEALKRADLTPDQVQEVIMGNVLQAGLGQGPARQTALKAGVPHEVPATTVNKLCGSGLKAVHLGAQAIQLGEADIIVSGGMENMSQAPHLMTKSRTGYRMGDAKLVDSMLQDGLQCAVNHVHMGVTAENIAGDFGITRDKQDAFAAWSQQKTEAAVKAGRFNDEIAPVAVPQRKGDPVLVGEDEFPRSGVTAEGLGKMRPAFQKDGTVTAANASGINDGAAAVVLMSREKANELGITPLAVLTGSASAGVDPRIMGTGPVPATRKLFDKTGLTMADMDLIEANEAFASQALSVGGALGVPDDKLNVNGGAISLGHPIGASGTRILVTLLHEMKRRQVTYGLATLCIGGGMGISSIVKREES